MMKGRSLSVASFRFNWVGLLLLAVCQFPSAPARAATGCQLIKLSALRVDDSPQGPVTTGTLDGHEIKVLVDSGSNRSTIVAATAERFGLHPVQMPGVQFIGIDGKAAAQAVDVKRLEFGSFVITNRTLLAAPSALKDVGLILGADVLSSVDVEIDLAKHSMVLWQPRDCKHTALAYWSKRYMAAKLHPRGAKGKLGLDVQIDGRVFQAILDTGTDHSMISVETAHALGFDYRKARVQDYLQGFMGKPIPVYLARFKTFSLGPMTVKNPRLLVSDVRKATAEIKIGSRIRQRRSDIPSVFIGADFLRANHVYIANSQRLFYFTYEGGTIFQRGP